MLLVPLEEPPAPCRNAFVGNLIGEGAAATSTSRREGHRDPRLAQGDPRLWRGNPCVEPETTEKQSGCLAEIPDRPADTRDGELIAESAPVRLALMVVLLG